MIKSISQWAFKPDRSPLEVFQLAAQHGFPAVELAVAETGPIGLDITRDQCREIVNAASSNGIQIASLASGLGWHYPVTTADEVKRERGIQILARSLEIGSWLGVDALLVVPGGVGVDFIPGYGVTSYDLAYANASSAMLELAPVAEKFGVALAIENVWNKFLLSPLEMRDFIDHAGSPFVGSYFDVGNVLVNGYPEQWINILGSRIKRIHFKDFKRAIGNIDGFCDLLDGDVDYPAVIAALNRIGYDGPVTAEFFNCEDDLAKLSAAMDKILQ
ncbi:MAG TPA: sugar phosphate isomerase/epimerase family protein [Capsulimonadaceae bacterium]|jgi:hexulose-6-phosphate isomerase